MLSKVNLRITLLMTPVALCSILQFCRDGSFLSSSDLIIIKNIIPWLFAIGGALVLPNRNKTWMIIGTTVSYFIIYKSLSQLEPSHQITSILSAFCGPLVTSIFAPKIGRRKRILSAFIINYSLAVFFLSVSSIMLSHGLHFLYNFIKSAFNSVFINSVFDSNFSFIYSVLYQFCQTFGLGEFVKELREVNPLDPTSISFYSTTISINIAVIPGIFLSLAIFQPPKRRFLYFLFFFISIFGAFSSHAICYLLLSLLWLYPSLYTVYLILCIFLYFIGQYVDFKIIIHPSFFYKPNLSLSNLSLVDSKFLLFSTFAFLVSTLTSMFLIIRNKKYDKQISITKRSQQIQINYLDNEDIEDCTINAVAIIKLLGGFNNINIIKYANDNQLIFTFINANLIHVNKLLEYKLIQKPLNKHSHNITLTVNNAHAIYEKINTLSERLFTDVVSDYQDLPRFDIKNSSHYEQIQYKEHICLGSK